MKTRSTKRKSKKTKIRRAITVVEFKEPVVERFADLADDNDIR